MPSSEWSWSFQMVLDQRSQILAWKPAVALGGTTRT